MPAFPYQDGWLGADSAYSVPLAEEESLWLFGDTFVGEPEQRNRRGARFIHNSIARSRCDETGSWSIRYHWGAGPEGARDFIDRGEAGKWWWLFDGFVHAGELYIGLLQVESAPPRGPLAMPFAFTGVDLARVANPLDEVEGWRIERLRLSRSGLALPASAMVVHGAHVYLFTFLDRGAGSHPRILVRLPLASLEAGARDLEPALETLARDGSWKPGLDPTGARVVMDDDATEMSVDYQPALGAWLALYSYPSSYQSGYQSGYPSVERDGFPQERPSDRVWVRTAASLEGPWSPPRSLIRVPELDPSYVGGFHPDTACYGAKAHPQLSTPTSITITYVCNLFAGPEGDPGEVLGRLADDMGLYRPIAVRVTLPPELIGADSEDPAGSLRSE